MLKDSWALRVSLVGILLLVSVPINGKEQVKVPLRLQVAASPGSDLVAGNFDWANATVYRFPTQGYYCSSLGTGCFLQSVYHGGDGKTHLLYSVNGDNNEGVGVSSLVDMSANSAGSAPINWASATRLTCNQAWGLDQAGCVSGAKYDMWQGKFGSSYDTGSFAQHGCEFDSTCLPMLGGYFDGTYFNTGYGSPYGPYVATWSQIRTKCIAPGNCTSDGPWHICAGVFPYGGAQSCGPRRTSGMFPCKVNGVAKICDSVSGGSSNQDPGQVFGFGLSYLDAAPDPINNPVGYGNQRGLSPVYRDNDVIETILMAKYNLTTEFAVPSGIVQDGHDINEVTRRPKIGAAEPYIWEAYIGRNNNVSSGAQNNSYAKPSAYGGVGTWAPDGDVQSGTTYVEAPDGHSGPVQAAEFHTDYRWYRTVAGQENTQDGIVFDRTVGFNHEAELNTHDVTKVPMANGGNADFVVDALLANQHYRMTLVNPGASHGTTDCSYSAPTFTITLKTDGGGNIIATGGDVVSSINSISACNSKLIAYNYGDGSAVVNTFTNELIAQGPDNSPVAGVDCHVVVTGPCVLTRVPAIGLVHNADMPATPDYNVDYSTWIYPLTENANIRFRPKDLSGADTNRYQNAFYGIGADNVDHSLWLCAHGANATDDTPLFYRIPVISAAPSPNPITLALAFLIALPRRKS